MSTWQARCRVKEDQMNLQSYRKPTEKSNTCLIFWGWLNQNLIKRLLFLDIKKFRETQQIPKYIALNIAISEK